MKSWIHFLGGSVSVYLLMAACSAASSHHGGGREQTAAAGKSPGSENGGAPAASSGGDTMANAGTSAPNGPGGDATTAGGMIADMVGDVMDPVPDADASPTESGSRLKAKYIAGEDGSRQFNYGWHDTKRDEDCTFQKAEDGKLRCMPSAAAFTQYYSDASCTVPVIAVAKATSTACGSIVSTPVPTYANDYKAFVCSGVRLVKVTGVVAPSQLYIGGLGTCTETTVPADYTFYGTTHVPASEFVAGTEEIE